MPILQNCAINLVAAKQILPALSTLGVVVTWKDVMLKFAPGTTPNTRDLSKPSAVWVSGSGDQRTVVALVDRVSSGEPFHFEFPEGCGSTG